MKTGNSLILLGFLIAIFIFSSSLSSSKTKTFSYENCENQTNKLKCMLTMVNQAIKNKDIEGGLKLLDSYSKTADFAVNCHGKTHSFGREAYKLFKKGEKIEFSPLVWICNWGFYHGFMESLSSRGENKLAKEFCREVDRSLKSEIPGITSACYHGVGHGVVNAHDKRLLGDTIAISTTALNLCKEYAFNKSSEDECASGVFMGLSGFMAAGEYKLFVNSNDPLWYCRKQPEEFKTSCFSQSYPVLRFIFKEDIKQVVSSIENTASLELVQTALREFTSSIITATNPSESRQKAMDMLAICSSLNPTLSRSCIAGLEEGLVQSKASFADSLCEEESLTLEDKKICMKEYLKFYSQIHNGTLLSKECARLESKVPGICQDSQYFFKSL